MAEDKKVMLPLNPYLMATFLSVNNYDELHNHFYMNLIMTKDIIELNIEIFKENENNDKTWYCDYCDVNVNYADKTHTKNMEHHRGLIKLKMEHQGDFIKSNVIKNLLLNDGDFNKLSITEIMEFKYLVDDTIKIKKNNNFEDEGDEPGDGKIYCEFCNDFIKSNGLKCHLKTKKHNKNFKDYMDEMYDE